MTKRFAVLSSTGGSVIREVYSRTCREEFRLDLVISDRECGALDFANETRIEACLIESKSNEVFSNKLLEILEEKNIDYLYLFFTRKLVGEIIEKYSRKIINYHPSLLPACPGLNGFEESIKSGAFIIGSTAHFVTDDIDSGEKIMQTFTQALGNDTTKLRHIIFAQQCATLYFLHRKINSVGLESIFVKSTVNLSKGFIPNVDKHSMNLYYEIVASVVK